MSGIRSFNFREGDRSEYLANYLLSGLGLVTAVPRQEDIGFDFYCQLADQEEGNLTFGFPFIVQVKSEGIKSIGYGDEKADKWKEGNIQWLFRLEIPFFVGIVCKQAMRLDIYNTSPLNFIFFENPRPSRIEFKLRETQGDEEIGPPVREVLTDWAEGKGDGFKYQIDLGRPIISITNEDIYNVPELKAKKDMLRNIILLEQENQVFRKLKVPFFRWARIIHQNGDITPGWAHLTPQNFQFGEFYGSAFAQSIVSVAINLMRRGREEEAIQLRPILKRIRGIDPAITNAFPRLFD